MFSWQLDRVCPSNYAGENDDGYGSVSLNVAETNGATNTIAGLGFNTVNRILSGTYGAKGHYESTYY